MDRRAGEGVELGSSGAGVMMKMMMMMMRRRRREVEEVVEVVEGIEGGEKAGSGEAVVQV